MSSLLKNIAGTLSALLVFGFAGLAVSQKIQAADGSAAASLAESLKPKKFLLSIGIDSFADPIWPGLRYPRRDAENIYDHFLKGDQKYDGGILLNSALGTSRDDILEALEKIKKENRNEDDVVVLYISTHGTVAYKKDGRVGRYVLTSKSSSLNVAAESIDYDELVETFNQLKSRKKVLILAFCHSGVGKSALTPEMKKTLSMIKAPYFDEPIQQRSEGTLILSASGWREPALEDENLKSDVYTHFLLAGFENDRNGDGAVTMTEAHDFAAQMTFKYTNGRQRPSAIVELLGADPIVVKGKSSTLSGGMLYSLMQRFSKFAVNVNGVAKGTLSQGISLPAGRVKLEFLDENGKLIAARVVKVKEGQEFSVADLLTPRFPDSFLGGYYTQSFVDGDVKKGYAPDPVPGFKARYLREDFIGIFDGGIILAGSQKVSETIVNENGRFEQKRQVAQISLVAAMRERIRLLTSRSNAVVTDSYGAIGPGGFYFQREVDEPAFNQRRFSAVVPGIAMVGGLQATLPFYLLRFGLEAEVNILRGLARESGVTDVAVSAAFLLGTFW